MAIDYSGINEMGTDKQLDMLEIPGKGRCFVFLARYYLFIIATIHQYYDLNVPAATSYHGRHLWFGLVLRLASSCKNLPTCLRGHPFMTSAKFSDFLTPSPPCPHLIKMYSTKFTQPPLLRPHGHYPPPPSRCRYHIRGLFQPKVYTSSSSLII